MEKKRSIAQASKKKTASPDFFQFWHQKTENLKGQKNGKKNKNYIRLNNLELYFRTLF